MTNVVVSKRNDTNVMMIKNVFAKKEAKKIETNVDIRDDSWKIIVVWRVPCKSNPIRVITGVYERFTIAIWGTWNFAYFRPEQFLD